MDLYGCNFWNLAGFDALFFTLWRKCIRKLLYLSPMTHSRFLPLLCDDIPVELQLFRRFNKFSGMFRKVLIHVFPRVTK